MKNVLDKAKLNNYIQNHSGDPDDGKSPGRRSKCICGDMELHGYWNTGLYLGRVGDFVCFRFEILNHLHATSLLSQRRLDATHVTAIVRRLVNSLQDEMR